MKKFIRNYTRDSLMMGIGASTVSKVNLEGTSNVRGNLLSGFDIMSASMPVRATKPLLDMYGKKRRR